MTKLLIVLLATIFFTGCSVSKNTTHRINNANSEVPLQNHYSINGRDYAESWRSFNEAKLTLY